MGEQDGKQTPSGQVLKEVGGFELVSKVGQGGMGAVFKARQKSLDRIVALKILPPSIAKDKAFIERFVREARASAKLAHPNVVGGIDVGQDATTGLWYFAMEFVDGPTAKQVMQQQGKLPEDQALKITRDIANALECAHQNGMVHRDVKPDNILLNKSGTAKLADLGLARHAQDDASLTQSGVALGTPFYMPPEQVRGEVNNLDTRADLYALGATLFHLVTGQTPFQGETSAVIMAKHLSDPPPMANRVCPDVSAGCSKLILKLMQKDKAQRLQTPQELIQQIDRLLKLPAAARGLTTGPRVPVKGATTTAPRDLVRPRPVESGPTPASANHGALYAGVGAGAVVLLGIIGFMLFSSPQKPPAPSAKKPDSSDSAPVLASANTKPSGPAKAEPQAPKETPLERRWRETKAFATAQPEAYEEILHRYQRLAEQAAGAPQANEIEAEMMAVEEKYDTAAQGTWQAVTKKIGECTAAGDYDAALAATRELPPAFAKRLSEHAQAKQEALTAEAQAKIVPVLEKAEAFIAALDPQAGLDALKSIEQVKFQPLAERTSALRERLERDLANVDELRARKKLEEYLTRFDTALLKTQDEAVAARVASEAKGAKDLDPVRAQADAMAAILAASAAETKRQEEALKALKGHPFAVGKDQGAIDKVVDGVLYVQISLDGGKITATKTYKIAELPQAQRDELFPPMENVPAALQMRNILRKLVLGEEDLTAAQTALNAIPEFPLTAHYLKVIEGRQSAVAEASAARAWQEIATAAQAPMEKPEQALPVFEKLQGFLQKHGKTEFAKGKAEEIAALKTKVEAIARPNLIANGDFESGDLKGWQLEGTGRDIPVEAKATTTAAHSGKYGLHFTSPGFANYNLTVVPGQTYRVSCWAKSIDAYIRVNLDNLPKEAATTRQGGAAVFREWKQLTFTFTATKPTHFISLLAWSKRPCQAYFDDAEVTKAEETTTGATEVASADATAQFVGEDARTQGNWKRLYGKEGFSMAGDEARMPAYATLAVQNQPLVWDDRTDDPRGLFRARGDRRFAAAWHAKRAPVALDLNLTDGREHTVAVYMVDFKSSGFAARAEVMDPATNRTLDARTIRNYDNGLYLVWRIKGSVRIRVQPTGDSRHVYVSGVFLQ